ncbi:hypothetical protein D6821_02030 [Candidatus Parcubacteria bacterium]|nr:MAG: hypothetical protein D6821_02030 [Candidatus Parcubacteria bacterium]
MNKINSKLSSRKKYLQIALNNTLDEAQLIIACLPISDQIIIEAGTPLIKRYGLEGIKKIKTWYKLRLMGLRPGLPSNANQWGGFPVNTLSFGGVLKSVFSSNQNSAFSSSQLDKADFYPYVVADLKMMDRGETEVDLAAQAGADAATALGHAPIESLNAFIQKCEEVGIDAMIDMMNVEYPLAVLRQLKKLPRVVILHRGVDEERLNKEKQLPLYEIKRIKGSYDMLIAVAGGDSLREAQRAIFNDADIVVVWKSFFQSSADTAKLAKEFLREVK